MNEYLLPSILSISILLEIASAITALLLIKTSKFYKPWFFIAVAITLMAVRRITSLHTVLLTGTFPTSSLGPELIALIISVLMLTGLILFRPAFYYIKEIQIASQRKIEKQEMLMKENNHRIKNNLAIITSLINLKDSALGDEVDLSDIYRQIDAIRIVHEKLYLSDEIIYINLKDYFTDLLNSIFLSLTNQHVTLQSKIEPIKVRTKTAVSLGLVINEVATNAIKYGFAGENEARFAIEMSEDKNNSHYVLTLSNTGVPFPENIDLDNPATLGLRLIKNLVAQIDGTLELRKQPNPKFTIKFPIEAVEKQT